MKFPIAFSSPDWRTPGLSASPHIPVPSSAPWPLCCTHSVCSCLSCTGEPRTGPISPYGSHQCWLVGKLVSLVLLAAPLQPRMSFAFFVAGARDGFVFSLMPTRTLSPFLPSCILAGWPPACILLQIQDFEFVEFHEVPVSPFSILLSWVLDGSTVLQCISNSVSIQRWPLWYSTSYQSLTDHHPLGLAMQFSVLLSVHSALSVMGDSVKSITEVKAEDTHCSALVISS